ncbi:nitrate reductase molybdenum cofactor assembly chaperone [Mycobacterium sp. KBS0706]|uniref:nitrate reductase molybdenum cofactor assembly chaperone n=1 Tax=Mycobacterium sp. KBS0706 TaxID=2578109 RepID=UPI00110FC02B|nr:nitrate reductase molybdenum cofactor assembly chaperone [Mycobacterium sp. KBS0706]TSD84643.1 nitrate reductase molybdenum cofactor assembly chaperone [Mycobacterium sp. KBS0706]
MAGPVATKTFKALSALLTYPTAELTAAAPEIGAAITSEGVVDAKTGVGLAALFAEFETADLYDLQEHYVDLFDRTRKLSLHLFEHVHGESRDRGQALVDLAALYEKGGLVPATSELPDHLPLFLEYLATRPLDEARALLADTGHIIAAVRERLDKRGTSYAAVFSALLSIASGPAVALEDESPDPGGGNDLAALDAAWEEAAVTFGPGASDGCPAERLGTRLRAAQRAPMS